jgi:murein DD-endopeptidase MepM/ murein hydrolase activator NlpD
VCSVRAGLTRADGGATADPVEKTPAAPAAAHKASAEPSTRPKSKKEPKPTSTPKKSTPKKQLELKPTKEPAQPQPARAGAKTVRHTVRTGETLSGIAEQLGVPGGWQPLYAQNRATVGADPNLILPGEQLSWTGDVAPAAPVAGLPTFARSIVHHADVDLAAPVGTPVQAVAAGTVVLAGWAGDDGNLVKVRHPGGGVSRYAHLSRFDVRVGEQVTAGATVGLSGATGKVGRPRLRVQLDATDQHGSKAGPAARPAGRGVAAV